MHGLTNLKTTNKLFSFCKQFSVKWKPNDLYNRSMIMIYYNWNLPHAGPTHRLMWHLLLSGTTPILSPNYVYFLTVSIVFNRWSNLWAESDLRYQHKNPAALSTHVLLHPTMGSDILAMHCVANLVFLYRKIFILIFTYTGDAFFS